MRRIELRGDVMRSYDKAFKQEAARLVIETGRSTRQIATELDIPERTLNAWVKEMRDHSEASFPGRGKLHEDDDNARLRKENAELRPENEILKKATAIFIKDRK